MGLLRTLPILAAVGVATIAVTSLITNFYEENEELANDSPNDDVDEELVKEIKDIQCELARLYDLQTLNTNRESTGQVHQAKISVDGSEISLAIFNLEKKLKKILKKKAK